MKIRKTTLPPALIVFSLLFLFSPLVSEGQFAEEADNGRNEHFIEWAGMPVFSSVLNTSSHAPGGGWVVGGRMINPLHFVHPPVVIKLSATGEMRWQKTPMDYSWEVGNTEAIINTREGDIIVAGTGI